MNSAIEIFTTILELYREEPWVIIVLCMLGIISLSFWVILTIVILMSKKWGVLDGR